LNSYIGTPDVDLDAILEAGLAHENAGRFSEAQAAYRQVLAAQPTHARALYLMGMLSHKGGRNDIAAKFLLSAWENDPDRIDYLAEWSGAALNQVGSAEVLRVFHQAIERAPERAQLHEQLGALCLRLGRDEEALACYQRAVALDPTLARAHANMGILLNQKGQFEETIAASKRAIELAPGEALGHYALGHALLKQGQLAEALTAFRAATALAPTRGSAHTGVVVTLLRMGDAAAAARAATDALQRLGYDSGLIAYQYYALHELGDTEAARALLGMGQAMRQGDLPVPPGYPSLDLLNQALAAELQAHPTLVWEPLGRTTRRGRQSSNLLEQPTPALQAFLGVLRQVLDHYLAMLPTDASHPFYRHKPASFGLDIWTTVLVGGGHQDHHIHSSGWLSGVYYVQLPETLGASAQDNAGWIEFGRPPDDLNLRREPPVYTVQPRAGLLILFPSYVFHRTIPFAEAQPRISIAFDLIP
jgi:uncharacterized protein (TIGR02466 family)